MNGMIAMRTIIYFLVTSLISAIIGLVLVLLIHPGNPETKATLGNGNTEARTVDIVDNFMDLGRNLFPDNMFKASFQTVIIFFFSKSINIWYITLANTNYKWSKYSKVRNRHPGEHLWEKINTQLLAEIGHTYWSPQWNPPNTVFGLHINSYKSQIIWYIL